MEGYRNFALAYDEALGFRFHEALARFVPGLVRDLALELGPRHLDIGSGTGLATALFARLGLVEVTGLDLSYEMLDLGRTRNRDVVCGDAGSLPFGERSFGSATSFYDALNHLAPASFSNVISEASRVLRPDGVFLFDLTTRHAYEEVWSMPDPWESSGEHHELGIHTEFDSDTGAAVARIRGIARRGGVSYRIDETRRQWCHDSDDVVDELRRGGFELIAERGFDPFGDDPSRAGGSKMIFVAKKGE